MDFLQKIEKLARKPRSKWTAKDREYVVQIAAQEGVQVNPLCPDCYIDTCVIILNKYKADDNPEVDGYQLRAGLDVWHAGMRVNAALLNAENARKWLAAGLPERYFIKMPSNED